MHGTVLDDRPAQWMRDLLFALLTKDSRLRRHMYPPKTKPKEVDD